MQLRDLKRQYENMRAEMDAAIADVVASGGYVMGEAVEALESELAAYVGVRHCVSCANGTDALRMALMALGIGEGDAVYVPDFTFFATAEAVAMVGATPVFVDVRGDDCNIDVVDLERKLDEERPRLRAAAVIAVDLFGRTADYGALRKICHERGLLLVEDGAQGFGGSLDGRRACSFGDISTTSFFPAKPLGCYGDGGAIFTDNDEWAAMMRSIRVHGRGEDKYDNVRLGLNSRLDTVQAAVLRVKLRHFDNELAAVAEVARRYGEMLQGKVQLPPMREGETSSWAQYTVQSDERDALQTRLKAAGIPTAVYYPRTMSQQTAFAGLRQAACPMAERLTKRVLSIPMHPYLSEQEIEQIATAI